MAKQLKEVGELLGAGLNRQLAGALAPEYVVRGSLALLCSPAIRRMCCAAQHTCSRLGLVNALLLRCSRSCLVLLVLGTAV